MKEEQKKLTDWKVGDQFVDRYASSIKLGVATITRINGEILEVNWQFAGPGGRSVNDPDLRKLTKLEKALK